AERPVHVVIWTDRAAEWSPERRDSSERKPLISVEGWSDRFGDRSFPLGGFTALVQAVRLHSIVVDARSRDPKVGQPLELLMRVAPSSGATPLAVHIVDPSGRRFVERVTTDATGHAIYLTRFRGSTAGNYSLQAFILGGTIAGQAESPPIIIRYH